MITTKDKVKQAVPVLKHCAMKTYEGVGVKLHAFLTSLVHGSVWSPSRPRRFALGKFRTVYIRYEAGAVVKRKNTCPCRESNSGGPAYPVAYLSYV
jgi:hypothetical protein